MRRADPTGPRFRFVALPRWVDSVLTFTAGSWLFVAAVWFISAAGAIAGDASLSEILRIGGAVVMSLFWFVFSAISSTWWRTRLDQLLTPRPASH